jgi:hypothetical protein
MRRSIAANGAALLAGFFLIAQPAYAGTIPGTTCPAFPADNWWNADVSKLPLEAKSAAWMSHMGSGVNLHPDFGPSFNEIPVPYGIPITVVNGAHAKVNVDFDYATQSDNVPYPLGGDTKVEGGQWLSGDRHTVVVDKSSCKLYETWDTSKAGGWHAGSGAVWDLKSNKLRPKGWTSADAAGLPILPGLLRYEEVAARHVDHAIRFTAAATDKKYLWPARHQAGSVNNANYPPMGARFRLKANYKIRATLRPDTKAVLAAMKKYGLVLADNGSNWYFGGTSDTRWPNALLDELKQIPASAFEAVDTSSLMVRAATMQVKSAATAPAAATSAVKTPSIATATPHKEPATKEPTTEQTPAASELAPATKRAR